MSKKQSNQHFLKKDRYAKSRGGNSHFLDIYCGYCSNHVLLYQKDGKGALLRLYIDRIFEPIELSNLQIECKTKVDMPKLVCSNCKRIIGMPMVYQPEQRLAFVLIRGGCVKKKSRGMYPPM